MFHQRFKTPTGTVLISVRFMDSCENLTIGFKEVEMPAAKIITFEADNLTHKHNQKKKPFFDDGEDLQHETKPCTC